MKKMLFCFVFLTIGFTYNSKGDSPCPTGFNTVESHWWPPFNDHYYVLCNCQTVKGTSASGNCSGGGGNQN